jgi:hypothetical protein
MLRRRQQPTTNKEEIKARQHNPRRNMFSELASGTRPRCRAGQSHEERSAGVVLQITNDPVGPFPPSGGKVMTTNAFGLGRKLTQEFFCFQ